MFADSVTHHEHLAARDVTFVFASTGRYGDGFIFLRAPSETSIGREGRKNRSVPF